MVKKAFFFVAVLLLAAGFGRLDGLPLPADGRSGAPLFIAVLLPFRRRGRTRKEETPPPPPADSGWGGAPRPAGPRMAGLADVEIYFLDLFRAQLGSGPQSEGRVEPLGDGQYRLKVFHNGEWHRRRMSLRPLGEGTGSKSQCFYAIFDTHLVIKIPPVPIRDLDDYLGRLRREAHIVAQAEGRPCIIPNVTAVLSRIHRFGAGAGSDPQRLEQRYHAWLASDPDRQRHLMVAGAFAFFMDLSRFHFLADVMSDGGDAAARLLTVVEEDVALIEDCEAFEDKYGTAHSLLCFELQTLYGDFDLRLRRVRADRGETTVPNDDQKKSWLLGYLAGVGPVADAGLTAQAAADRDRLLATVVESCEETAGGYRRLAAAAAQQRRMTQLRPRMASLGTNMLELLAWLGERRVSMRDLKPDNLLVAGRAEEPYPHFLVRAGGFVIGLIDLGTAVIYPSSGGADCPQPQLGGTPSYATPSHFFANEVLAACHPDIGRVLHLQDWHAVGAIVFEIVTGRRLYANSAPLFPSLVPAIRQLQGEGRPAADLYRAFSRQFWNAARSELTDQMHSAAALLEAVSVGIPESLGESLGAHLEARAAELERRVADRVAMQDVVRDASQCRDLARSGAPALERLRNRYRDKTAEKAVRLVVLLDRLIPLKKAQTEARELAEALSQWPARLTAAKLIPLMFETVAAEMLPAAWPDKGAAVAPVAEGAGVDPGTLGFTHTVDM